MDLYMFKTSFVDYILLQKNELMAGLMQVV